MFPVLRECVNSKDVVGLSYNKDKDEVIAKILTGGMISEVSIDVSCESGSAMVIDVVRRLM